MGGAEMTSGEAATAFLAIPDGWGIVDTAASQALIGEKCLDKWTAKLKGKGFQVIRRAATGPAPVGIGGKGKLVGSALVPTRIGEADGIMEFQVMKGDIPPLLPIQALTELGVVIDVPDQKIFLKHLGCEVAMMKLPPQHCAIELSDFREGEVLNLPAPLEQRLGVRSADFQDERARGERVKYYRALLSRARPTRQESQNRSDRDEGDIRRRREQGFHDSAQRSGREDGWGGRKRLP